MIDARVNAGALTDAPGSTVVVGKCHCTVFPTKTVDYFQTLRCWSHGGFPFFLADMIGWKGRAERHTFVKGGAFQVRPCKRQRGHV